MSRETIICTYNHCRCENKNIPIGEEVRIGRGIYHKQCAEESNNIKEIKKLYYENISMTVVQGILGKVINDIIYGKFIDSAYLLFALKYAITNKIKINTPYGLHYLIDNYKIKNLWIESLNKQRSEKQSNKVEIINTEDSPFYFRSTKQHGINSIIKE